jgi:hypothetical protein
LTLAAVHAYAHLKAQPALLPSHGILVHAHAHVLYPVVTAQIPTTLTLAAVHAYAHLQAQPALLPSHGIQLHVHAHARYLTLTAFFHTILTVSAVHVFVLSRVINALLINILMRQVVLAYRTVLALWLVHHLNF